jgi:hypothetical protein
MAVTATAVRVPFVPGPTRPPVHAGWNNPAGDPPPWIADTDWYRRIQLTATGAAGEVGSIVNWEILDPTIPVKTTAQINALADGATGALINNTTTWTIWAYTGTNVAGQAYRDTRSAPVSFLRANGPRVQVVLGPQKKIGDAAVTYNVYAFLPGAGKTPSATTTVAVQNINPVAVTGVTVDKPTVALATGSTTITATVAPAGATVKGVRWSATPAGAVTITDAAANPVTITRAAAGTATVTVTTLDGSFTATSSVTDALEDPEADAEKAAEPKPEPKAVESEPKSKKGHK